MEAESMRKLLSARNVLFSVMIVASIGCFAASGVAQDEITGTTEITGYYQKYQNFSFNTGVSELNFSPTELSGVGFSVAQNIADWFALWTQLTINGTNKQWADGGDGYLYENSVRIINNLQGIRYQTKQYGPFRLYGKFGAGFTHYSFNMLGYELSGTKFSAGYGGGADIWFSKHIGVTLDVSHTMMMLPNLTDVDGRESVDSGLAYTTGLTFRF